jgi:ribosome-binding factor A
MIRKYVRILYLRRVNPSQAKSTMSETIVQKKTATLIQKELSDILSRDLLDLKATIITVSVVRMSPDLGLAKVYISTLPDKVLEETVGQLNEQNREVRYQLGRRIRNRMRKMPELMFYVDDSFREAEKIDRILDQLEIPETKEDEETD